MAEEEQIPRSNTKDNITDESKNIIIFRPISSYMYMRIRDLYNSVNIGDVESFFEEENNYGYLLNDYNRNYDRDMERHYMELYISNPEKFKYFMRPYYVDGVDFNTINFDLGYKLFFPELFGNIDIGNVDFTDHQMYNLTAGTYLMDVRINFKISFDNSDDLLTRYGQDGYELNTNVRLMIHTCYRPTGSFEDNLVPSSEIAAIIREYCIGIDDDTKDDTLLHINDPNVSEHNLYSIQFTRQLVSPLKCDVKLAVINSNDDAHTGFRLIIQNDSYIRFTRIVSKNIISR